MVEILHPNYKIIKDFFERTFKNRKKIKVLDYGCGAGRFYGLLRKHKNVVMYKGLDINLHSIQKARRLFAKDGVASFSTTPGDSFNFEKSTKYDCIILIGVLQYMSDMQIKKLLISLNKVLNKGGIIIGSTVTDHLVYKIFNLYQIILPNRYINRNWFQRQIASVGLNIELFFERGLFLSPLVSHVLMPCVDVLDKLVRKESGDLGGIGRWVRLKCTSLMLLEYNLPIDYGFTLYFYLKKVHD